MAQPRFLLDDPMTGPGEYLLNRQESHHAVNVLRLRTDDVVIVFDGRGNSAEAVVLAAHRDGMRVRVDGVRTEEHLPLRLTIATAIPKGKRWQTLVEKCTELGVDRIIPILSERSVVKGEGDADKWRRWAVEAAKQSRRAWIPEVSEPMALAAILPLARNDKAMLLIADPGGESPAAYRGMLEHLFEVIVLIGPEGGFTDMEAEDCVRHGARTIRLSPFTLRIETAAAAVCALVREIIL